MADDDWLHLNRTMWDKKVPLHVTSAVYDVEGFKRGATTLRQFERDELEVRGRSLLHLQCHFGLDTLSWAREGARVTGLDFAPSAIAAAQTLADETGLEARFVCADVYDASRALDGEAFDIVYTGVGALCWLPDMTRWANVVAALLRPGGELYLYEFHPLQWILEGPAANALSIADDYFTPPSGYRHDDAITYAAATASEDRAPTIQWNHPFGEVVTALAGAGLRITSLRELDQMVIERWPGMVPVEDGMFRLPAGQPNLPLMYILRAQRPIT